MRFLRTASTGRLLAVICAVVVVAGGGTAIAVAATGAGPVPPRTSLASALHHALTAPKVSGITANVTFTNNLIDSSDFTGRGADPVLQGASGRLWLADDGRMRLELQSDNGDAQVVVNQHSFWISDPSQNTVYKGTLPAEKKAGSTPSASSTHAVPTVARIQSELTRLMARVDVTGALPTDVAGRAAYRVSISPKHDGGLLGSAQIAWDALRGVPLELGIYARGNPTPVLDLKATRISYGTVPTSDLNVAPPVGAKVVTIAGPSQGPSAGHGKATKSTKVHGLHAVAGQVPFTLDAPATLVGLPRHTVSLLKMGDTKAALVSYGANLGGMAVIESAAKSGQSKASSPSFGGLSVPTVSINGVSGQELSTALGTVISFTRGGVHYTVIGSVPAAAAELAARALAG